MRVVEMNLRDFSYIFWTILEKLMRNCSVKFGSKKVCKVSYYWVEGF